MAQLQALKGWLEGVHPGLGIVALAVGIWASMSAVRRWLPGVWEFMANLPWTEKLTLGDELDRLDLLLRKAWQAIPSIVSGAVVLSLVTGGDWREAFIGAVVGAVAPIAHEALKRSPLPYGGKK